MRSLLAGCRAAGRPAECRAFGRQALGGTRCHASDSGDAVGGSRTLESHLDGLRDAQARLIAAQVAQKRRYIRETKPTALADALSHAKARHPQHVVVVRNGGNYEVHGTDVALCVEYCGLQPTGGTSHLEIPADGLQRAVGALRRRGIGVVVYDFVSALELSSGDDEVLLLRKSLVFSHEAARGGHEAAEHCGINEGGRSIAMGVTHNKAGFSISCIDPVRRTVEIRDRLTFAAALSLLQKADGRVVIFQNGKPHVKRLLSYLPTVIHCEPLQGNASPEGFHEAACASIKVRLGMAERFKVTKTPALASASRELDRETAAVLGLGDDPGLRAGRAKGLHAQMLPDNAQPYMKQYMRFLLSHGLSPHVAENVRYVVGKLASVAVPLVDTKPVTPARVRGAISQQKVDLGHLRDVDETLKGFTYYTQALPPALTRRVYALALGDLNVGFKLDRSVADAERCSQMIGAATVSDADVAAPPSTGIAAVDGLFRRSEAPFGCVQRCLMVREMSQVDEAACRLLEAITKEYVTLPASDVLVGTGHLRREPMSRLIREHVEKAPENMPEVVVNEHFMLLKALGQVPDHTKLQTTEVGKITKRAGEGIRELQCYERPAQLPQPVRHRRVEGEPSSRAGCQCACAIRAEHRDMRAFHGRDPDPGSSREHGGVQRVDHYVGWERSGFEGNGAPSRRYGRIAAYISEAEGGDGADRGQQLREEHDDQDPAGGVPGGECWSVRSMRRWVEGTQVFGHLLPFADEAQRRRGCAAVRTGYKRFGTHCGGSSERLGVVEACLGQLVQKNGTVLLGHAPQCPAPLKMALPNNAFLSQMQQETDSYIKEIQLRTQDAGVESDKYVPCEPSGTAKQEKRGSFANVVHQVPVSLRDAAVVVLEALSGIPSCSHGKDVVHIFADCMPPPMLHNAPVLYVLVIPMVRNRVTVGCAGGDGKADEEGVGAAVYVGETGNLEARLRAHRAKPRSTVDEYMGRTYMNHEAEMTAYLQAKLEVGVGDGARLLNWQEAHAFAVKAPSRRDAKIHERRLIKRLYDCQDRVVLLSQRDGVYREIVIVD
ncbi:DNA mismatch repair protein MSH1 [Babesia caballi]|uniref:DNA mismatch repair protein MSH1 n=1 Tax=Babesia caballi TaxID=5871 RepID=A0AAV4LR21_BABCB|nr:DNA mismatch repair protein MSH1 [Babesia caballi]